jgi:hypothetical protein
MEYEIMTQTTIDNFDEIYDRVSERVDNDQIARYEAQQHEDQQALIKQFRAQLDIFQTRYGAKATCEVMSALCGSKLKKGAE